MLFLVLFFVATIGSQTINLRSRRIEMQSTAKSFPLLLLTLLACVSSCSGAQSKIKQETYLDLTSNSFPLFPDGDIQIKLYSFKKYESYKENLLAFDGLIIGDNLNSELASINETFNQYNDSCILLVAGTFGTSDTLSFTYNGGALFCDVYVPSPATEGLVNKFVSFVVDDENLSMDSDVSLIVNYEREVQP